MNNIFIVKNSKKGFTLVEMLVYVAILSVLSVVVINTSLSLARSYNSLKVSRNINSAAIISFERMTRDIRLATNVDTSTSTLNSHPGRLGLEIGTATTSHYYLDGTTLRVIENGVDAGALTTGDVEITNLIFRTVTDNTLQAVKIEMTIESTLGNTTKTEKFYDFVTLRGTYF